MLYNIYIHSKYILLSYELDYQDERECGVNVG